MGKFKKPLSRRIEDLIGSTDPDAIKRLRGIEKLLASRGFYTAKAEAKTTQFLDKVYRRIVVGTYEKSGGFCFCLYTDLEGKLVLPPAEGALIARLKFDPLSNINVMASYDKNRLFDFRIGNEKPKGLYWDFGDMPLKTTFQLFPENPNSIPGFGIYEGEGFDYVGIMPKEMAIVWYKIGNYSRPHSLEKLASLPHVEPNMLALHRLAGSDFAYLVRFPESKPPAEHYLVFNNRRGFDKNEISRRSINALFRIVDRYKPNASPLGLEKAVAKVMV